MNKICLHAQTPLNNDTSLARSRNESLSVFKLSECNHYILLYSFHKIFVENNPHENECKNEVSEFFHRVHH